eukprot:TRINITY_DN55725_c0_g1_i1.p1 TRINITY_DN55725_c0_g1~~TRINITY_DN55725_c0_g1_i1.p1  ORF type:complete len:724 (+),score=90.18 TRINITY_DN55725_c0_g1_i1:76-2172(+)
MTAPVALLQPAGGPVYQHHVAMVPPLMQAPAHFVHPSMPSVGVQPSPGAAVVRSSSPVASAFVPHVFATARSPSPLAGTYVPLAHVAQSPPPPTETTMVRTQIHPPAAGTHPHGMPLRSGGHSASVPVLPVAGGSLSVSVGGSMSLGVAQGAAWSSRRPSVATTVGTAAPSLRTSPAATPRFVATTAAAGMIAPVVYPPASPGQTVSSRQGSPVPLARAFSPGETPRSTQTPLGSPSEVPPEFSSAVKVRGESGTQAFGQHGKVVDLSNGGSVNMLLSARSASQSTPRELTPRSPRRGSEGRLMGLPGDDFRELRTSGRRGHYASSCSLKSVGSVQSLPEEAEDMESDWYSTKALADLRELVFSVGRRLGRHEGLESIVSSLEDHGITSIDALRRNLDHSVAYRDLNLAVRFYEALRKELNLSGAPLAKSGSSPKLLGGRGSSVDAWSNEDANSCSDMAEGQTPRDRRLTPASGILGTLPESEIVTPVQAGPAQPSRAQENRRKYQDAVSKHLVRYQQAREQKMRDIHGIRISANRWEHWDDPWRDTSGSSRCRRAVIPMAGKGERSASLIQNNGRSMRSSSASPRLTNGNANVQRTARGNSKLSAGNVLSKCRDPGFLAVCDGGAATPAQQQSEALADPTPPAATAAAEPPQSAPASAEVAPAAEACAGLAPEPLPPIAVIPEAGLSEAPETLVKEA